MSTKHRYAVTMNVLLRKNSVNGFKNDSKFGTQRRQIITSSNSIIRKYLYYFL